MKNLLAVATGGAIGTYLRYLINLNIESPLGTLIENLIGSFVLGALTAWFLQKRVKEWLRVGLGVGLCGGFTTMSTLAFESFLLYERASFFLLCLYWGVSVLGGIMLAFSGHWLVRWRRNPLQSREVSRK